MKNATDVLLFIQIVSYSFIPPMEKEVELKKLGAHIQEIRNGKGITQEKLAHIVGKDRQSIQRLEVGNVNPTYFYLQEIAAGLDMTVGTLIVKLEEKNKKAE